MWILILLIKGYIFHFGIIVLGLNFVIDSTQYHTARSLFYDTKILITRRKRNQNQNYFNPLVRGPGFFE